MDETRPLISIIIPAYNIESLLSKCVSSVLAQTYPSDRLEIIIVDDGSTDETGAIADRFALENGNVSCIHESNMGSSAARNAGIGASHGEYIGFIDSDDYIDASMYEELMEAIISHGTNMAQVSRDEISEDGTKRPDVVIPPSEELCISDEDFFRSLLMHTGDASFCTKLTKATLFEDDMKFPTGFLNEDFYLMYHMLPAVRKIAVLPHQAYHVFYRKGSNSRKEDSDEDFFPPVFTDIVRNADAADEFVKKCYPRLASISERFGFAQRLDYLLHIPVRQMTADNDFYMQVVRYLRKKYFRILTNTFLTGKERAYLLLLAPMPRFVRRVHIRIMNARKK